jgi:hypothetical protein
MYLKQLNVPATVALPSGKRHKNTCTSRIYWRAQQGFEYIVDLGKTEQTKQGKEPSAMKTRASRPKHITPEILSVQMITDEKIVSQCYLSVILRRRTQKYLAKVPASRREEQAKTI